MVTTHGAITLGRPRRSVELPGLRLFEVVYAPGRVMRPHAHRHANVSLVLEGEFEETIGERTESAGACSVVVKPHGTVHSNRFGARSTRSLIIEILPPREAALTRMAGARLEARWLHEGPAGRAAIDIYHAFRGDSDDLHARVTAGLIEIIRASAARGPIPACRAAALTDRAESILRSAAERPPSCRDVAAAVGIHPVYLARLFQARRGCGVAAFRRRVQVREAARRLVGTGEPLGTVALAAGFADQSHLCRAFRRELGLTPGGFRRLVRAG